jgi:hypothetical protein
MNRDELTPEERKAFDALPRKKQPPRLLEERTVAALREHGVLSPLPGRGLLVTPARAGWVAAAAACLVLVGFALGQWTGPRTGSTAFPAPPSEDGLRLAAYVQQAGSAYVGILRELSESGAEVNPFALEQAKQAAVASLYAASDELVRLVPEEKAAQAIREAMVGLARDDRAEAPPDDRILWF